MSYSNRLLSSPTNSSTPGPPGIGFKLTDDGNYNIDGKRLTNVADSTDDNDVVNLKVLKNYTQVSQNNYHLQPSFKIYKNFGDKSQLTVGKPPNTPSNHFFNSHKAHHDPYIVDKEADDTGFSGEAWSSMIMKGNQLERGTYTSILEIFVIGDVGGFRVDDTIIYQVWGDSHYTIITFDSDKINGQYTRSIIQFTTDGGAGADDGIKFQIKYFGSQYNKNIKFLFYSRVVKGKQSTSFNHTICNVSDVQDNHEILYFENLNLNGNLINGLGNPTDQADAVNKKYVDVENTKQNIAINYNSQIIGNSLFHLDGSKKMTGDLDMNENHILSVKNLTDHKVDDAYSDIVKDLKSVVNKEYLNQNFLKIKGNDYDLNQYDDNTLVSKAFVDAEIAKLPKPDTDVLKLDGSKAMTGDLDMGMKKILYLDSLNDYTNNSEKDKDLKSAVNKEYLNTHFLKIVGKGDYDFNLGGQIIKNCEPYYDGLFDDNSLVSKAFVDAEIKKIPSVATDVLKIDGSKAMTGALDMGNHNIITLKEPEASDSNHAASVKFVNTIVNNSESGMINLINDKIKKSEEGSIEVVQQENVFKKVMDDDEFKEDDSDIHKVGVRNKNFHLVNKKTYEFKIDYDSSLGYYSTRLSIDLIYLPVGSYTMVYEMYIDNGITVDEIDSTSGTLVVGKINSKIDRTNTRSIIHFTKYTISPGFDDLDIDIKLKGKTDPQTTINVVVYGVKGQVNNVSVNLWDRFYYYDNTSIKFELPVDMNQKDITGVNKITTTNLDVNGQIDMKNKDITGVNKITTADLDVNSQIDMKGNKIIGVGDGTSNNDAVNKIQLDMLDAKININKTNIQNINNHNWYFAYTNQLKHNNENTIKFPPINRSLKHWRPSISYPFELVPNDYTKLKIKLDGWYQINYTDNIRYGGQFQIYDNTNSVYLFVINLPYYNFFSQFTINAIFEIIIDKNLVNYVEIKLMCEKPILNKNKPELDGVNASSFFIKYLGP